MIIPEKNRIEISKYLFQEGHCSAKKDYNLSKHPKIDVPNLQVIQLMQGFKSKEYVRETWDLMHYYWYLTNDGIEFLRSYLNLPPEIMPANLNGVFSVPVTEIVPAMADHRPWNEIYKEENGGYCRCSCDSDCLIAFVWIATLGGSGCFLILAMVALAIGLVQGLIQNISDINHHTNSFPNRDLFFTIYLFFFWLLMALTIAWVFSIFWIKSMGISAPCLAIDHKGRHNQEASQLV
ncbi:uncharacterized protein LOC132295379 isoform X2 [Cornus florida]|uniref:uncharacterized protein LOC132295379 isoform X2 n=1 Tax=Cornus florida TaxID=4283 RepID=UPI00289C9506|nr:uncharacterized protein LOC132295379 isoform X2 [Cornus florida]